MIHEGRPANVAGKGTSVDEIIQLAGAINPASAFFTSYKPLAFESLLAMQPDVILVSERSFTQNRRKERHFSGITYFGIDTSR